MTDQQILDMKRWGLLKINKEGKVWTWHRRKRVWIEKVEQRHPVSGRVRYMIDVPGTKRSTVYKNRLIYVYFNGATNGMIVNHKDVDRTNNALDNLQLHTPEESQRQGYEEWKRISLEYFNDWWDYVRFFGEPPPDDAKNLGSVYA